MGDERSLDLHTYTLVFDLLDPRSRLVCGTARLLLGQTLDAQFGTPKPSPLVGKAHTPALQQRLAHFGVRRREAFWLVRMAR